MAPDLYNAAVQKAALLNFENLAYLEIKGDDAKKFLQGMTTNDILKLNEGEGCYTCTLTPKGKLIADFFVYACGETLGLVIEKKVKDKLLETLKRFVVFQKTEILDRSRMWEAATVIGPQAVEALSEKLTGLPAKDWSYTGVSWKNQTLWVIRKPLWNLPSFEIWVKKEMLEELTRELAFPFLDEATAEVLRIESATPRFGTDMDENTIPQEANLYNTLSFDKGCYVGQEIVARLEHRGHVGKQLVQLKSEGSNPPAPATPIRTGEGKEVGHVTSSCFSPRENGPLCLGYIRHAFLKEKTFRIGEFKATRL